MAKRLLSMVLSLALVLSCISGITLFTMADADAPYAWFDTANGECEFDGEITDDIVLTQDWDEAPVEEIGDTGEYGICITEDGIFWGGIFGELDLANMACVINYYVDGEAEGVTFTYQVGDANAEVEVAADAGANTIVFVPTADEVAAAVEEGEWFRFIFTCATENVYIQSAKLVDAACTAMDDADAFHTYMLENELNLTVKNAAAATDYDDGYTGDVHCVTCDALLVAGEDIPATSSLPRPYAYMETADGTLQTNFGTGPVHASGTVLGNTNVVQIPGTEMYGIKLTADWTGFYVGGNLKAAVPANTAVVAAIECYATAAGDFLRFVGTNSIFVDQDKLGTVKAGETSLIFVEFSAAEVAAWGNDMRMNFQRTNAAGDFYVKSVRLIDAQYVDLETPANDYYDFGAGKVVCDYYPDVTVPNVSGMAINDGETGYRYFTVTKASATSHAANEPVYIKVYTTAGNENTTLSINTYQHYKNGGTNHNTVTGAPGYNIKVENGVGGVLIPEACFTNGLNGRGSFRFSTATAAKIARIEVYKLSTYCNEATATTEMKAELHAAMLASGANIVSAGRVEPTLDAEGQTGTVSCAACGTQLSASTAIPKLETYAQIDFNHAGGAKTTSIKTLTGSILTPVQIPGTSFYGLRYVEHNSSFSFSLDTFGITAEQVESGEVNLAISVEYYLTSGSGDPRIAFGTTGSKNLALYAGYRNICYDSVCVNPYTAMKEGQMGLATFTVGKDITYHAPAGQFSGADKITTPVDVETNTMAKALINGSSVTVLGWLNGMNASKAMYIKSITIHNAADLVPVNEDRGYYYQSFAPVAVDPIYYPQYTVTDSFGIANVQNTEESWDQAGNYPKYGFMYLRLGADMMTADGKPTPAKLVIKAKEGTDLSTVRYQYQVSLQDGGAAFSGMYTATLENGYYEALIPDAIFKNGLNAQGSLRLRESLYVEDGEGGYVLQGGDDFADILEIQVYDLRKDCEAYHSSLFTEANGNLVREGRVESTTTVPGYSGDLHCVHCGAKVAAGEALPLMQPFAQLDFSDGTAKYTSVKSIYSSAISLTPVQIPGTNAYGMCIDQHNAGVTFSLSHFGITAEDIANGKEVAITLEYYIPSGLDADARIVFDAGLGSDKIMAFYNQYKGNTWDAAVLNPSAPLSSETLNVATFLVGKNVNYVTGPGQFSAANKFSEEQTVNTEAMANALVSGDEITLMLWRHASVTTPVYVKSITIYDAKDYQKLEQDTSREYINYESEFVASPVYYPQYSVQDTYGLSWRDVDEGVGADGLEVIYRYFVVTDSKVAADKEKQPVVIRFTMKEESEVARIALSYQKGKTPEEGLWGHIDVNVINGVGEILLEDAAFTNGLNGGTSFRVWNVDRNPVGRDLAMVEVYAVKDKTALTAILDAVEEDILYKTSASIEAYMAVVNEAKAVADDAWATEAEIAEAVAALEAARALLVTCVHGGEKELVNFVEATCLKGGYSGDMACADCGYIADEDKGADTPAHPTRIINVTEATCSAEGNLGDTWCDTCQKIAKQGQKVAKLPHTWDEGEITKPATKDELGEITKTCTACGKTTIVDYEFTGELGDVDGSGKVDSTDARLVLQYAVKKIPGSALELSAADVNGDGKVDSTDARLILQYAVKKINNFPTA